MSENYDWEEMSKGDWAEAAGIDPGDCRYPGETICEKSTGGEVEAGRRDDYDIEIRC